MHHKLFLGFLLSFWILFLTFGVSKAQTCNAGDMSGNIVGRCDWIFTCAGCQGYCGQFNLNSTCYCGGSSCSCPAPGGGTGCTLKPGTPSTAFCTCMGGGAGSTCSANRNKCGVGVYTDKGECSCTITYGTATCTVSGTAMRYCPGVAPTATPGGGGPAPTTPPPIATATPIPTATPTPAIIGNIYNDPNDGTVAIGGGGMCVKSGAAPVGTSVANALIEAVKTSNGAVSAGLVTGSSYRITAGLVSGASDYTLALILPTPAAGVLTSYVCSCPASANEYLCNYSNINANGTANFFVRQRCTRLKSSDAAAVIG